MNDINGFLEKVRADIKGGKQAHIIYNGSELKSIRQTSNKILSIRDEQLVGVYDVSATDMEIIDDCLHHIDEYNEKQAKQSQRLNKALGMA